MTALVDSLTVPLDPNWLRVVDPQWAQPLDPMYAARTGGRWNPPGIPTLYLCDSVDTARAQVRRLFADRFVDIEDLADTALALVSVTIPAGNALDAFTDAGLAAIDLPSTYPQTTSGASITHQQCQPIGRSAFNAGLDGVCARSAAPGARPSNIELAWFPRGRNASATNAQPFGEWR